MSRDWKSLKKREEKRVVKLFFYAYEIILDSQGTCYRTLSVIDRT